VGSMTEETFRIPVGMLGGAGDVTLVARPLASRTAYRTDRLMVAPGQRIDLRLENNLQLSNYAIW
jgi:hypothetical protein